MDIKDVKDMYFEEYDDQDSSEFELVGVEGAMPSPITDLTKQVNELRRLYGKSVSILVYRSKEAVCV